MNQNAIGKSSIKDRAYQTVSQRTLIEQASLDSLRREATCDTLSNAELATRCLRELSNYRLGEQCDETYGLELLSRAIVQGDQDAWAGIQQCLGELVRGWLRSHPSREAACRWESEENYVALAFERFWQATTQQQVAFKTFTRALAYLRASLNGAILYTLRAFSRPREVPLPSSGELEEPQVEDCATSREIWDILQSMLLTARERRLAYLLYHCGLKPREMVHFSTQEWSDVQEIYRLRLTILERLLPKMDHLRWRFNLQEPVERRPPCRLC